MHLGCYIEEEGEIITQGRREGRMFILDTNQAGTTLFAKGQKVELDIDLWHKRFGHVKFPRLCEMQTKNIVSDCQNFGAGMARFVKLAKWGRNTDFHSSMSVITVEIR